MAAPIKRYSDQRLYGLVLVKSFDKSLEWITTVAYPRHPQSYLITEVAIRAMKIVTGTLTLSVTIPVALIGRIIQISHYHFLSANDRKHPKNIQVNGVDLPAIDRCTFLHPKVFHGTNPDAARSILRWGFDLSKTSAGAKMGRAIYVSAAKTVPVDYGEDQLILSLDLREGEIGYLNDQTLSSLESQLGTHFHTAVRELFYRNGYRAIKYDLDHYGTEEAWAIYDPSCITITKIKPSPRGLPQFISSGNRADKKLQTA